MAKKKKYFQRPDGLYEKSKMVKGKRVVFRARTIAELERKLMEYLTLKEKGRFFCDVAEEWIRKKEKEIAGTTFLSYDNNMRLACEAFDGMRCSEIRPLDVQRYAAKMERDGVSKSTCNARLSVARQILSYAVMVGEMDSNPASEIKPAKNMKKTVRRALTEEQERLVLKYKGDLAYIGLMFLFTGGRRGEILALEWQDIDRKDGCVHFAKKLDYANPTEPKLEEKMKSANGVRDVPLFDVLADALPRGRIGRIFTDDDGNYLSAYRFNLLWKQYCTEAGLLDKDGEPAVTPHQFRHSYATICFEAGIDPKTAASFLGDTEAVTQAVYTELRETHREHHASVLQEHITRRFAAI